MSNGSSVNEAIWLQNHDITWCFIFASLKNILTATILDASLKMKKTPLRNLISQYANVLPDGVLKDEELRRPRLRV